jgi:phosphoketolase
VRGYKEKGNINTPLELAILNQVHPFNLVIDAIDRVPRMRDRAAHLMDEMKKRHHRQPSLRPHSQHRPTRDRRLDVARVGA